LHLDLLRSVTFILNFLTQICGLRTVVHERDVADELPRKTHDCGISVNETQPQKWLTVCCSFTFLQTYVWESR